MIRIRLVWLLVGLGLPALLLAFTERGVKPGILWFLPLAIAMPVFMVMTTLAPHNKSARVRSGWLSLVCGLYLFLAGFFAWDGLTQSSPVSFICVLLVLGQFYWTAIGISK